jgi:2-oxoisovalerate dehydrogenase E2 component (dihydrolipoyl transacylase)
MATDVRLPQLGESTYEATIGKWLKRPGDAVARFEPLVELITDKVNVEMPAPFAGRLVELVAAEGATLPTGAVIARMELAGAVEDAAAYGPSIEMPSGAAPTPPDAASADGVPTAARAAAGPETSVRAQSSGVAGDAGGPRLSPLVSRLLREHGIPPDEWDSIPATGTGGRISKGDVVAYAASRRRTAEAGGPPGSAAAGTSQPSEAQTPAARRSEAVGDQIVRLDPVRKAIAERMARSKREIPHAYGMVEVDMTDLVRWHDANKAAFEQRHGVRLTYTAFFVRAAVEALRANRFANAEWRGEVIVRKAAIHVGVAVSHDSALFVPVLHDADGMDLATVAAALDTVVRKVREGRLGVEDVQGGTFTITNPGVFGAVESVPVINPPQAAILAANAIVPRAVVREDAIVIRRMMNLGLAFDHRVFDGAEAMTFLGAVKSALESVRVVAA